MLERLNQLVIISEQKTLLKASEILSISQPALTRSMQKLEEELGVTLFERTKNKIALNDNGKLAVKLAKKIIKDTKDMKKNLLEFDRNKKTISIGTIAPMPAIGLKYIFKNIYPLTSIEETITTYEKELIEGLENNKYSIIVLNHPLKNKNFITLDFFKEELYLSVPINHQFAKFKTISFQDLDGTSVLLRGNLGYWKDLKEKVIPHSTLIFENNEMILNELIKSSTLPSFRTNISLLRLKENEDRIYIPFIDQQAKIKFYIIYKKNNRHLFDCLKQEVKELDWKNT